MIECACDHPDKTVPHELNSSCYVWYKLKVKHRGEKNAGTPIERDGKYDYKFGVDQ